MKLAIPFVVSLMFIIAVSSAVAEEPGRPEKAPTPSREAPGSTPPEATDAPPTIDWDKASGKVNDLGLRGDYLKVAEVTDATAQQQKQLLDDQEKREELLKRWDEENEKKLARYDKAIAHARSDAQAESLKTGLERLRAQRAELAERHLARSVKSLTPEQQKKYDGYRLWTVIEKHFEELNVKLDKPQQEEAVKICTEIAGKTRGNAAGNARLQKEAYGRVGRTVLTDEQKRTAERTVIQARIEEAERRRLEKEREEEEEEED